MKHRHILKRSVKEAFDNLPGGVCFFNKKGLPVLCNHTMHRLSFELTGRDLQSLPELLSFVNKLPPESEAANDGRIFITEDNSSWKFTVTTLTDRYNEVYTEISAADITELHKSRIQLEENNKKANAYGKRLRELSADINAVTREEEILNMKMRVHDEIGRSVIAARQLIKNRRPTDELDISAWKNALRLLKNDSAPRHDKNAFEQLVQAAAGIGITIKANGSLPDNPATAYLMITSMRECATNAVRHAGATLLYADIVNNDVFSVIRITNNGSVPEKEITEGGGTYIPQGAYK